MKKAMSNLPRRANLPMAASSLRISPALSNSANTSRPPAKLESKMRLQCLCDLKRVTLSSSVILSTARSFIMKLGCMVGKACATNSWRGVFVLELR